MRDRIPLGNVRTGLTNPSFAGAGRSVELRRSNADARCRLLPWMFMGYSPTLFNQLMRRW
jgi:hypothetical protein